MKLPQRPTDTAKPNHSPAPRNPFAISSADDNPDNIARSRQHVAAHLSGNHSAGCLFSNAACHAAAGLAEVESAGR